MRSDFLNNYFSYRLFHFILKPNLDNTQIYGLDRQISFGNWSLLCSFNDSLEKIEGAGGKTFYFLGAVFEYNANNPMLNIGHYVGFCFDPHDQSVTLFRSRNSFIGIYFTTSSNEPFIFGDLQQTQILLEKKYEIDLNSIGHLLEDGMLTGGLTLFKGLQQLPFQKQLKIKNTTYQLQQESPLEADSSLLRSGSKLFDFLMDRFSVWLQSTHFKSIAVSGGTDSRLLFSALLQTQNKTMWTLHSRLHPLLKENEDADVIIARELSKIVGLPHSIQQTSFAPSAYLSQEPPARPPLLTGLYGGELLGGEILNLVTPRFMTSNKEENFSQAVRATAQMFTCDFYSGGWASCFMHHNLTMTPFLDSRLISLLLACPTEWVERYNLYSLIYDFLPESLRKVPLVSMLADYHERHFNPHPEINPKSLPALEPFSLLPKFLDFCDNHEITKIKTTPERRRALQNLCISLQVF